MSKPRQVRLSARIRQLRRFFDEYDRAGVVLGGGAVDALAERLRSFEIDAADLETREVAIVPRRAVRASEIGRRYQPVDRHAGDAR